MSPTFFDDDDDDVCINDKRMKPNHFIPKQKQIQETDDGATAAEAGRIPRTVEVELREDLVGALVCVSVFLATDTHTHTHTYIYIYVYI